MSNHSGGPCFQRSLRVRCSCAAAADGAKPTEGKRSGETERKAAEPASAAAATVEVKRGGKQGADFDTADSPLPPSKPPLLLVCDILL